MGLNKEITQNKEVKVASAEQTSTATAVNLAQKSRRKVLKTAGVAGVAGATAAWHKPVIDAVLTPAHAQTSQVNQVTPISGAGSSTPNPIVSNGNNSFNNIVQRVADGVVPQAHAGAASGGGQFLDTCIALYDYEDDYSHCVSLNFPDGDDRNGTVEVSLTGPDVYYGYQCYYYTGGDFIYYYDGVVNFSNSGQAMMNDGEFSVSLGDVEIFGQVNDEFTNADGTMVYQGSEIVVGGSFNTYSCTGGADGAYWGAVLGEPGGVCAIGAGVNLEVNESISLGNPPCSQDG